MIRKASMSSLSLRLVTIGCVVTVLQVHSVVDHSNKRPCRWYQKKLVPCFSPNIFALHPDIPDHMIFLPFVRAVIQVRNGVSDEYGNFFVTNPSSWDPYKTIAYTVATQDDGSSLTKYYRVDS